MSGRQKLLTRDEKAKKIEINKLVTKDKNAKKEIDKRKRRKGWRGKCQ